MKFVKSSLLVKLVILILVVYATVTLVRLRSQINEKEAEAAGLTSSIASTQQENDRLQSSIDALDTPDGLEQVARDLFQPIGCVECVDRTLQTVIFLLCACDRTCQPGGFGFLFVDLGTKAHQGNSGVHNEDQNHQLDQQRRLDEFHSGVCSFPVVRVSNREYAYRSLYPIFGNLQRGFLKFF